MLEAAAGVALLAALMVYALTGGADFGGGVWDLTAGGERAHRQRALIERAIAPIWEANHVWLIAAVVILFTAFPPAFAAIATALHVPLTLLLIGIVLRGSAFVFRAYDSRRDAVQRVWSRVFAVASLISPVLLGVIVGAISSGRIGYSNDMVTAGFFDSWLTLFALSTGLLTLALFAMLAAIYLTLETTERDLQDDFRKRALVTQAVAAVLAVTTMLLSETGAPGLRHAFETAGWALGVQAAALVSAVACTWALAARRFALARVFGCAQLTLILAGWGMAQYPHVVQPDITIWNSAAPQVTLRLLLGVLALGSILLVPSFIYLFKVFRKFETGS